MKQKGNTSLNNPFASSFANTGTSIPPPRNVPSPPCTLPSLLPFPLLLLMTSLWMRQLQINQGDLAGRPGKQILDLMDQLLKKGGTHMAMKLYDREGGDNLIPERKGESNLNLKASLPLHWAQQLLPPLVPPLLPAPVSSEPPLVSVPVTHSKKKGSNSWSVTQEGAIGHILEVACSIPQVPDDHMIKCAQT